MNTPEQKSAEQSSEAVQEVQNVQPQPVDTPKQSSVPPVDPGKTNVENDVKKTETTDATNSGQGTFVNAAAALAFQYSSGNNVVSRASTPKPAPKPESGPVPQLKADRGGGRPLSIPKYMNSAEYLRNVDLNFGQSANPITAEFNGKLFGSIGAGALGGVLAPAAGSAYGAASSLTLNASIQVYSAGTAAAGAIGTAAINAEKGSADEFKKRD